MARPKGTPNAKTQDLYDIASRLKCNPFEVLIHFANGDSESLGYPKTKTVITKDGSTFEELTISPELRMKSAGEACSYLFPKRKAIEHTFDPGLLPDDELVKETAKLLKEISEGKT